MAFRLLLVSLFLLLVSGCGPGWVNHHYKDKSEMNAAYRTDSAFCREQVDFQLPRPRNNERYTSGNYMVDEMEDYDIDMQRQQLFDGCMHGRGWVKK